MAKQKREYTTLRQQTRQNKHREVRDVYNKLRKRYKLEVVYNFFRINYWLQERGVDFIINQVDDKPVDPAQASTVYSTVMKDDFYIL